MPTLVHDGKPVIESTLICEYIDETFPHAPKLIPADPWLQSRMRLWSKFVDEGLFDGVTEISFSAMFRERMKAMPEEIRQARFRNVGDPRRTDRFKSTYEHGVQSPFVVHAVAAYERAFKMLEATLAERRRAVDTRRRSVARRYQPDAVCGAPRLSRATRSMDGKPAACAGLVGARQRLAELQIRAARAYLGRMSSPRWRTHGPKVRDGIAAHLATLEERRLSQRFYSIRQRGPAP